MPGVKYQFRLQADYFNRMTDQISRKKKQNTGDAEWPHKPVPTGDEGGDVPSKEEV